MHKATYLKVLQKIRKQIIRENGGTVEDTPPLPTRLPPAASNNDILRDMEVRQFQEQQDTIAKKSAEIEAIKREKTAAEQRAAILEDALKESSQSRNSLRKWDEETQQVIEGRAQIRYRRDSSHLVNLAYRERNLVSSPNLVLPPAIDGAIDPHIRQTDFSAVWPLATNWKILARWNYDHSNARNLESFAGVEYSNCCAKIRLVAREWINENELSVLFFQNI